MKRIAIAALALLSSVTVAFGATLAPIQLLNPTGSTAGQAIVSTGASTAPAWGNVSPSSIFYTQGDTGSVARSAMSKFQDRVDAKDFGVKCDNSTDDTSAINTLLTSEVGKAIILPPGNCLYAGGGTLGAGTVVIGAGRNATTIKATAAAATLFTASGYGSGLRHIAFKANVTQTGGSYVVLSGPESFIDDFFMDGDFNGISMTGNVARIRHGRMQNGASGATRIFAGGGDNSQIIDDVLMGAQTPQIARAGIEVKNSFALMIGNVSVLQQGVALLIDPSSSTENVGSLYVHDSFFDFSSGANIKINPTGTGSVVRSRFANVWAGDSLADGVSIVNSGTGAISGIHFISPHFMLNTGAGLTTGGTVSDLSIIGGEVAQNSYGMYFNNAVTGLIIEGAAIGNVGGMSGNTNAAIVIAGVGTNQINIQGNNLCGNGSTISDSSGSVSSKIIQYNNCDTGVAGPGAFTTLKASQTAKVFAQNTSALSIPSSTATTVTGWTTVFDQHSDFVASTGVFTAPVTGFYWVYATAAFNGTMAVNTTLQMQIFANGALTAAQITYVESTTPTNYSVLAGGLVSLTAGQTVSVKVFQSNATAVPLVATATLNTLSITQVP